MSAEQPTRTAAVRGLPALTTPLGALHFGEIKVDGHVFKIPGFNFKATPEALLAIKLDAVAARSSPVPHLRDLGEVLCNMVDLLAKDLERNASGITPASMGFIVGFYVERLLVAAHEVSAASGAKSRAAAQRKGRKARVGSVREALERRFADWRKRPLAELIKTLQADFPDRDVESLRRSIAAAKTENTGG